MDKNDVEIIKEYERVVRQMIDRETDIVNRRIHWAFLMQSALFAAYWYVINSTVADKNLYIVLILISGVCFSLSTIYSVWTSERAIAYILSKWNNVLNKYGQSFDSFPPVWAGGSALNNIHGVEGCFRQCLYKHFFYHIGYMSMYKVIPHLFFIIWFCITILCCSHVRINIFFY